MKLSISNIYRTMDSPAANIPPETSGLPVSTHATARLRREALERLLIVSSSASGLIYLLGLPGAIEEKNWLALAFYGLVAAGLVALTFAPQLAHNWRAAGFLALMGLSGGFMLATQGLTGSGRLLLLLLPLLSVLLFAPRGIARLAALAASVLILSFVSLSAVLGYLPAAETEPQPISWPTAWLGFTLLCVTGALVADQFLRGMEEGLNEREIVILGFDRERQRLEYQVQEEKLKLERRLLQIHTAAEITQAISNELDLSQLLMRVCALIKDRFDLYYVGVFLIEPGSDEAVLKAGTGEAGQAMLAEGHRLKVGGESMVGQATAFRQARIALDIEKEDELTKQVRFDNPHLPETRSELALPLITPQAAIGALTIQSKLEAAFDENDIVVLQGIADSLASAIENARLFEQLQSNLDEISRLHTRYLQHSWSQVVESKGAQEHLYLAKGVAGKDIPGNEGSPALRKPHQAELPILLRGQQIGSLTLEADHAFSKKDLTLAKAVINQAALALENARLLEESRQRADQKMIAAQISNRIWSSSDIDTILQTALQQLGVSLAAAQGSIELWPEPEPNPNRLLESDGIHDHP